MTPGASRPGRALRHATVLLLALIAFRLPAIRHQFAAALAAGADPPATARDVAPPGTPAPRAVERSSSPGMREAMLPAAAVLPATVDPVRATDLRLLARAAAPRRSTAMVVGVGEVEADRTDAAAAKVAQAQGPDDAGGGGQTLTAAQGIIVAPDMRHNGDGSGPAVSGTSADTLASAAYARLAAGDRRDAVRLFDAALTGDDPRAATWRRQRDGLTRHWSAATYSILRARSDEAATVPVLGGGQSGAAIAFTPDPLSRRPLAATLRGSSAHDDGGRSAFVALGLQWRPFARVTLAAERLVAVGPSARGQWALRLAAGDDRHFGWLHLTSYAEGGIIAAAPYAAVQAHAAVSLDLGRVRLEPGVGGWASAQHDRATVDRVDLGPGVVARAGPLAVAADYRFRVAGNAAPASGPVLTLSAAF